jgi:hypothetical protein
MSQTAHNQYRYLGARNAWVCIFKGVNIARDIGARNAWVCIFKGVNIARDARASRRVERTAFVKVSATRDLIEIRRVQLVHNLTQYIILLRKLIIILNQ